MPQRKSNGFIGRRAFEEAQRIMHREGWSFLRLCKELQVGPTTVRMWATGNAPGSGSLLQLYEKGADVHYILTGIRLEEIMFHGENKYGITAPAVPIGRLIKHWEGPLDENQNERNGV